MSRVRVRPELPDDDFLRLFHRGMRDGGWTSQDVDWQMTAGMGASELRALTRLLTPVYLGEQSAMLGAAAALPELHREGRYTAALYLASFLQDEARHFEVLTRLYRWAGHDPVALRELPAMLRYHHRLRQGDVHDWLWGILISDVFARHFYLTFARAQGGALFGQLSQRILKDESRHQLFAERHLAAVLPHFSEERRQALVAMCEELLQIIQEMSRQLRDDARRLDIDDQVFFQRFAADVEQRGRRLGIFSPGSGGGRPGGRAGRTFLLAAPGPTGGRGVVKGGSQENPGPRQNSGAPGTFGNGDGARPRPKTDCSDSCWVARLCLLFGPPAACRAAGT